MYTHYGSLVDLPHRLDSKNLSSPALEYVSFTAHTVNMGMWPVRTESPTEDAVVEGWASLECRNVCLTVEDWRVGIWCAEHVCVHTSASPDTQETSTYLPSVLVLTRQQWEHPEGVPPLSFPVGAVPGVLGCVWGEDGCHWLGTAVPHAGERPDCSHGYASESSFASHWSSLGRTGQGRWHQFHCSQAVPTWVPWRWEVL